MGFDLLAELFRPFPADQLGRAGFAADIETLDPGPLPCSTVVDGAPHPADDRLEDFPGDNGTYIQYGGGGIDYKNSPVRYAIWSVGPDTDYESRQPVPMSTWYDPTNGTVSNGDIYRPAYVTDTRWLIDRFGTTFREYN